MLRAVIIDDELNGILSLELLIKKFTPNVKVVASTTRPQDGINLINDYKPEIVFLDINMPVLNGFELLEKLDHRNFYLVFTTAHSEYGLKALKQNATDYLLKPIGKDYIKQTIEKIELKIKEFQHPPDTQNLLTEMIRSRSIKIPLPTKNIIEFILPKELIYIEANASFCKVVLLNMEVIEVTKSLKEYESILCRDDLNFIRIHNSFIINLNYVTRYHKENGGYVVMFGNKSIPVSKHKKAQFLKYISLDN